MIVQSNNIMIVDFTVNFNNYADRILKLNSLPVRPLIPFYPMILYLIAFILFPTHITPE
jgi:hypothetical protein